jgi:prolyl oligopeptidase
MGPFTLILTLGLAAAVMRCGPASAPPPRDPRPDPPPARRVDPPPPERRPDAPPEPRAAALPNSIPEARRGADADTLHGVRVPDPYRWLEDVRSAEVQTWLSRAGGHTRKALDALPGGKTLLARLAKLAYVDRLYPPSRKGKRFFFPRQHKDKEKIVYYWQEGERGKARVLIDPNTLSADGSVAVHGIFVDWQGKRAAYKLAPNNADESTLHVMDVATGKESVVDRIPGAKYASPSWTPSGDGFYYTRLPVDPSIKPSDRPGHAEVYFHRLGTDHTRDVLVHAKTGDPRRFLSPYLTRDGKHLFIFIQHGWSSVDVWVRPERKGAAPAPFVPLVVGKDALYDVTAWKGAFYVTTNEGAPRYRLFRVSPAKLDRKDWQEIVPEAKDAVLADVRVVGDHLALQYLRNAATELRIATLAGKVIRTVAFPEIGSASQLQGNAEDDVAYYAFTSFLTPTTIYRTSVRKGGRAVFSKVDLPIDASPFQVERVSYPSRDGTMISMFLVHRRDLKREGSTPFMLYGYGGFNVSLTPEFRSSYLVWLEQGGGVAIPHLRGGGEYGEDWHQAGMLLRKQNTFDDFLAAARYLIRSGYTRADRLAIRGGSNGGLLVGAAMTQAPELFRAVSCHVPLLDMVRYHLFGSGKTWISEYGSADDPAQFRALHAYSPYHRVRHGVRYPALLMLSADSDDRVDPMHARKFAAAVRWATAGPGPVLLRVETQAGHGGGDQIKKSIELAADELAFLLHALGLAAR